MSRELVVHPEHYNTEGRKECWDEMIEKFGPEFAIIFDIGSAYKYYYRAGKKEGNPEEQDKSKISNYLNHAYTLIKDNHISVNTQLAFIEVCSLTGTDIHI